MLSLRKAEKQLPLLRSGLGLRLLFRVVGKREAGFTLLEVMIAMLVGTIGLMGTLAVQQAVSAASKNSNDAIVALRLATQKLDELGSRSTDTQAIDSVRGLKTLATAQWSPSTPEALDARGSVLTGTLSDSNRGAYRWSRQWMVTDTNPGAPYVISVIVSYNNDSGDVKTTRLDMERRKTW